ncbi:unnamed protein product [Spirodela intermedia]|uniref:Uncharacterized protein n=1 Tax=Spirodela intermedia TaxID=51605 RepID=A0A7I8L290_SPIIN|nr:unnamed protein product [Spirodela intermedia]
MGSGDSHLLSALRHHLHGGGSRRESQTQAAHHVPRGCVVVMVGKEGEEELERFVVPLSYLGHPLFAPLLREAAEEYGFRHRGAVAIPCSPAEFRSVLELIDREQLLLSHPHGGATGHHHLHGPHHLVSCFRA